MRITLLESGKTKDSFIREGVELFRRRIVHYVPFRIETLPDLKNTRNLSTIQCQSDGQVKAAKSSLPILKM